MIFKASLAAALVLVLLAAAAWTTPALGPWVIFALALLAVAAGVLGTIAEACSAPDPFERDDQIGTPMFDASEAARLDVGRLYIPDDHDPGAPVSHARSAQEFNSAPPTNSRSARCTSPARCDECQATGHADRLGLLVDSIV